MAVKKRTIKKVKHEYKKIEYITDIKGKKTKVIMPIESYDEILEDLNDLAAVADRKTDVSIPIEKVYSDLKKNGLI